MALSIEITDGTSNFRLKTSNFIIDHKREPLAQPIPGASNPVPIFIDIGQHILTITIEGQAEETDTNASEGGVNVADRDDLETMSENWGDTETVTITDNAPPTARIYTVKLNRIRLERKGGEAYFIFTITAEGYRSSP